MFNPQIHCENNKNNKNNKIQIVMGTLSRVPDDRLSCNSYAASPDYGNCRASTFIDYEKAENILQGSSHAVKLGVPLNRFMTVNWQMAGVRSGYQEATARLLKLISDWLRQQGAATAYVWVREIGNTVGEHVHILLSVPPELARAFSYRQRGWLKLCGANFHKGVIKTKPIGRTNRHAFVGVQYGECYMAHLARVVGYVLKGADPETRRRLGIKESARPALMTDKRCGTSQNIGRSAREKPMAESTLPATDYCSRTHCLRGFDLRNSDNVICHEFPYSQRNHHGTKKASR